MMHIVTVNAGSSSVKVALFERHEHLKKVCQAIIENIGQASAKLTTPQATTPVTADDHLTASQMLVDWLKTQVPEPAIDAVGHRIVHGGPKYHESQSINKQMLVDLRELFPFDPAHLPVQVQLIEWFQGLFPNAQQVACFDTAFHHDLPQRAKLLPVPARLAAKGVRRYGFHGLSYAFILQELKRVEGITAANGRVIIAHLGSGASLAALRGGRPIDTTMSMTPASGIPMSTRSGDLDPGLLLYLVRTQGYTAEQFNHMVNFESGLLGISGKTADMKKLLELEPNDQHAKDAVDIFCYQAQKAIGGFAAALGGLDTLVFTGGMGENAPKIRDRICAGLEFLGITLDAGRNQNNERLISADGSQAGVHVIHTDEATSIAREVATCINKKGDGAYVSN